MTDCPGDEIWTSLLAGQLSGADQAELYKHCKNCLDCQRIFGALEDPDEANPAPEPVGMARAVAGWAPPLTFAEFRIRKLLGQGAMGQVYTAHDMVLDRPVAVKFINSLGRLEKERFLVEARAIARLNHPNVVTLYRVGELDGRPYLVSELIEGETLDRLAVPIPFTRALQLGKDLAAGLAEAHSHGVVHRDIKPANVILSKNGVVKLLDFGLARLSKAQSGELQRQSAPAGPQLVLTQPGTILGTPVYMAPEAWQGKESSPQMDVYSLGALLYELCTAVPPHLSNEMAALSWKAVHDDVAGLETRVPDVDPEFAMVVAQCLQRDPAARFPSGVELHQALAALGDSIRAPSSQLPGKDPPLLFPKARTGSAKPAAPAAPAAPPVLAEQPPVRKQRRWQTLSGLLLGLSLLLSVPLGWYWKLAPRHRNMVFFAGGEFMQGSTPEERAKVRKLCERSVGPDCTPEFFDRGPQRRVRLTPFYLDITEVTNQQFADWLNKLPGRKITGDDRYVRDVNNVLLADLHSSDSSGLKVQEGRIVPIAGHERMPVVQVSWEAAQHYCQHQGKDLPTEAQWEFAARGKEGHLYPWGDGDPRCAEVTYGRTPGRECEKFAVGPQPVGSSERDHTPEGIYDLGGNVSEWVLDLFRAPYDVCWPMCVNPLVNTLFLGEEVQRVARGGNWYMHAEACWAAGRPRWVPMPDSTIGFRCAQDSK